MIKQITAAVAATKALTPGPSCKLAIFQNNGTVDIRYSIDGGSSMPNSTGTLPTTTTGGLLAAGAQLFLNYFQCPTLGLRPIWVISATGGAIVLDIVTDDKDSS